MVKTKLLSQEDMIKKMIDYADDNFNGNHKMVADVLGISPQYFSDVVRGRRNVSSKIAEFFGYRPVKRFEKIIYDNRSVK